MWTRAVAGAVVVASLASPAAAQKKPDRKATEALLAAAREGRTAQVAAEWSRTDVAEFLAASAKPKAAPKPAPRAGQKKAAPRPKKPSTP